MLAPTMLPLFTQWQDWLQAGQGVSTHTLESYSHDVRAFLTFLHTYQGAPATPETLESLEGRDIRAFLAARLAQQVTHRTTARNLSALRSFFQFVSTKHNRPIRCLQDIALPRLPKRLPRPIAAETLDRILDTLAQSARNWVDARNRAVFMLLYGAGLRISEALSLTIADMESGDHLVIQGKGRKQRVVPLLPICVDVISQYRAAAPFAEHPARPLFLGTRGNVVNPSMIQKAMRELRAQFQLADDATPHALRHSFATHLLQNGANLREVQALLGHSNLATTQQYIDVDMDSLIRIHTDAHPRELAAKSSSDDE